MKVMMLKRFALPLVLVVLIVPSFTFAQTNSNGVIANSGPTPYVEDPSKVVDSVDNNKGRVVLNDFIYLLKLNTKVYDQRKNLVNRYALKEGQRVLIDISGDGSGRYLDNIFILDK